MLSRLARLPRDFIRGPLAALPARLPALTPPAEFPCRIEALPEGSATIDNSLYADAAHAATWHAEDTSSELATLRLLNAARIPYFDRVWRQQLMLSPARPGAFLEIGCGGGIVTGALAGLGYHMTGVEPAAPSIEAAREHARQLGLQERMTFVQGDAYDLSAFPEGCFDGVVVADVLEHLYDLPTAVAQAWRVLRPGGVLVFDTVNRTYASYVLTIAIAQEALRMLPPHTHDWRLYVTPHELAFLLQVMCMACSSMHPVHVCTRTLDVTPHELALLLPQAHGFLCDTGDFRGLAPTLGLRAPLQVRSPAFSRLLTPSHAFSRLLSPAPTLGLRAPLQGAAAAAAALRAGRPPPLPLGDYAEISSLEVQYMGWALKPRAPPAGAGVSPPAGELSRGLDEVSRTR